MINYNLTTPSIPTFLHSLIPTSLQPFLLLSYPVPPHSSPLYSSFSFSISSSSIQPSETLYDKGQNDVLFVAFWAVAFTVLREIIMRWLLSPFARWWLSSSESGQIGQTGDRVWTKLEARIYRREKRRQARVATRFAEQGWSFLYCTVFWTLGFVILHRLPNPLSAAQLWGTYPYNPIPGLTKFYYLAQLGFWFHQIYVIFSEQRRKDHWQMFSHHIITIALMSTSYKSNFTRVGTLIHNLMDFCDILLPLAKMLRYLSLTNLCDATFVLFLVSWLITREIGFMLVIKSVYVDLPNYIAFNWSPQTGRYLTFNTWAGFIALLSLLQLLLCIWFWMAIRVAWRVVNGQGAEDVRSDSEEDDDEITEEEEDDGFFDNVGKSENDGECLKGVPNPHDLHLNSLPTPSPTPSPPSIKTPDERLDGNTDIPEILLSSKNISDGQLKKRR